MPKALAGLIIFFSATQLGYHFWPESSLVYGIRVDYLAPTIYFLDLLIILYLGIKARSMRPYSIPHTLYPLIPIALVNLLFSANPLASLFWSLRLLLYLAFFASLKISPRSLAKILSAAVIFQVFLAGLQVFSGHSLGGIFTWLGESVVAVGSPGIATASLFGQTALRSYATFGHPNALAGWLVACFLILAQTTRSRWPFTTLVIVGVLLTQSRSGMLALFGLAIPLFLVKTIKFRLLYFVLILYTLYAIPNTFSPARSDRSLTERLKFQELSLKALNNYPVFGAGAQASISTYPLLSRDGGLAPILQPDHNSFTLFLSWFGVFGVLAILFILRAHSMPHTLYPLLPIIPLLLLDHYLLTSPQGLFILLLYLRTSLTNL